MTRGGGLREDVRGIASVALATQFFRICFICHLDFWPSGHPDFWPSDLTVIRPSGYPTIRSSDHPVIRPSGLLVFWSSGLLSRCLKNVRIGIFLAYLIVGYTNLKFLTSSLGGLAAFIWCGIFLNTATLMTP